MKVDLNQEVDLQTGARTVFIASLATFIFTSLFAVSLANASIVKADATASVASANNSIKIARVTAVDDEGRGDGGGPTDVSMPSVNAPTPVDDNQDSVPAPTNKTGTGSATGIVVTNLKATVSISASPVKMNANNFGKVSWKSESVKSCVVRKDGVEFSSITSTPAAGISTGILTKDTKFTIECQAETGMVSNSVSIDVTPVPVTTAVIAASELDLNYGASTYLVWKSENAKSCTIKKDGVVFSQKLNVTANDKLKTGALTKNTKFSISCTGLGGVADGAIDINVKTLAKPTAKITLSKSEASAGDDVNVSWTTTDANKCVLMNGTRLLSTKVFGEVSSVEVKESTVFWISCSNAVGSVAEAVSIQVK